MKNIKICSRFLIFLFALQSALSLDKNEKDKTKRSLLRSLIEEKKRLQLELAYLLARTYPCQFTLKELAEKIGISTYHLRKYFINNRKHYLRDNGTK